MVLNWNIEVILDFAFALVALISGIVTLIKPNTRKIHSLHYIRIAIFIGFFSMLFDGISLLYVNVPLSIIEGVLNFPLALSMIIGVNYILKENYHSLGFTITFGLGVLLIFISLLPGAAEVRFQGGYYRIPWMGLFGYLNLLFYSIIMGYILYWGIKTVRNAPFLIKKEANLFFIGIAIYSLVSTVFYILYVFEPFFILVSTALAVVGLMIFTIAITLEPKLLYILPFTIYRIVVKDNKGYPLFDYDWSKSHVTENMFTGFINAVQLMSDEIIEMGGLLDINLKDGILILHESEIITVGLAASKTSKLLWDTVTKFTSDFENKFQKELKDLCRDMKKYETAYELIEKHFSNFPSRLIPSKSHPIL
ncbi:MAG: hypothetical protein P8Y23_10450 [Candidatus Lokiarchaeota archaeon]